MKVAFLCCVLLLAGSASCSPVEANSISLVDLNIPEWVIDLVKGYDLPDAVQNIIDRLREIIAAIPGIIERLPEIIASIVARIPEVLEIILDRLPDIIAQVPAVIDRVREILLAIIERVPEVIAIILEKIPQIIEAIPALAGRIKEIYDRIREILEELDLPDWFPTLPELEKPEWWPEIPELPEYNRPTPGETVSVFEYPGIVQIEVGTGPVWVQGCVGNILTSYHVLSAARCFSGKRYADRFRRVRAGSSFRFGEGLITSIDGVANNDNADLAVVRLSNNLAFGSTIQQASIVPQGFAVPAGLTVTTVGWGSSAQGGLIANRGLYQKELVAISAADCAERWNIVPRITIDENALCVGDAETGGRNGDVRDAGAPIMYQGIITGIMSFGAPVGNQHFPIVATQVGDHTSWIIENAV